MTALSEYLSTEVHTILKFCFEHSVVSQKGNKHTVPNKLSVLNRHPPLKHQKQIKAPGAKLNHYVSTQVY